MKINVDQNPEDAGQLRVMSIPTLVLFKDGKLVDSTVGNKTLEQLKDFVSQ